MQKSALSENGEEGNRSPSFLLKKKNKTALRLSQVQPKREKFQDLNFGTDFLKCIIMCYRQPNSQDFRQFRAFI